MLGSLYRKPPQAEKQTKNQEEITLWEEDWEIG